MQRLSGLQCQDVDLGWVGDRKVPGGPDEPLEIDLEPGPLSAGLPDQNASDERGQEQEAIDHFSCHGQFEFGDWIGPRTTTELIRGPQAMPGRNDQDRSN